MPYLKQKNEKYQYGVPMIPGPNLPLSPMVWCQIKFRTWCQSSSIYCKPPETKCNRNEHGVRKEHRQRLIGPRG